MKWLLFAAVLFLAACATDRETPSDVFPDYCTEDVQCVRQPSCCDCGVGTWINQEYQSAAPDNCTQVCRCAMQRATGVCRNNRCVGEPI